MTRQQKIIQLAIDNNVIDENLTAIGIMDFNHLKATVTDAYTAFPNNSNNAFDPINIGGGASQLTEAVRDIPTAENGITVAGINEGFDYSKLENARKLLENTEYTFNSQLGYISLTQRLTNDEVLAVAYQYTVGGQVYQVGDASV